MILQLLFMQLRNHQECADMIATWVFTILGYLNIVFVVVICLYLIISGIPAIHEIGFLTLSLELNGHQQQPILNSVLCLSF